MFQFQQKQRKMKLKKHQIKALIWHKVMKLNESGPIKQKQPNRQVFNAKC